MKTDNHTQKHGFELMLPDGSSVFCTLRNSPRAVRIRLRVLPDGSAEVVLPPFTPGISARKFAESQIPWLYRILKRSAQTSEIPAFPRSLSLKYLGGDFAIQYHYRPVRWAGAKYDLDRKIIHVSGAVMDENAVRNALCDVIKRCTQECIFPHLEGLAGKFGFTPGQCTVRIQRGRWGSCSSRGGAISLNALLLLLPDEIVEYILIHELCHLRQMNHSDAFWREVEKFCPDHRKLRNELRKRERGLGAYFLQN